MKHGLIESASLQRMLYEALDHSDDIVLVVEQTERDTDDLIIASANDAFCRAIGYSNQELIGRSFRSLAAPGSISEPWAELADAAQRRRSARTELLLNKKSGSAFWFGLHLMSVHDSPTACCVVLGRDITESRHARQQEAAIQRLLAKVFLCVKAPVAIVSDVGIIHMANPAHDELLGHSPGTLVGKPSIDFVAPSSRPSLLAARKQQIESGQDFTLPIKLLHASGSEEAVEITSIMVQHDDLRRFRIVTLLKPRLQPPAMIQVAGKIRLIGLDEVKEVLGPRWASVSARAMATAEHVVQRRCKPLDTYFRTTDSGFLICFADGTEEEAAFRAAGMAREIRSRLIGEANQKRSPPYRRSPRQWMFRICPDNLPT